MELYKGTIRNISDVLKEEFNEKVGYISYSAFLQLQSQVDNIYIPQNTVDFGIIKNLIDYELTDEKSIDYVKSKLGSKKLWNPKEDILYEIIEDDKGIKYAKEHLTGVIIPIKKEISSLQTQLSRNATSTFHYDVNLIAKNLVKADDIPHLEYMIDNTKDDSLRASKAEIESYVKYRESKFNKKKFAKQMVMIAKSNVIETTFTKKEERQEEILQTTFFAEDFKIMSEIDNLLLDLKKINIDTYNRYNNEYLELIDNKNDLTLKPYSKINLQKLKGEIEVALMFSKDGNADLKDYLLKLKKDYLERKETSIDILDYTKIASVVANSNTSMLEKRELLKLFVENYIYEIKESDIEEITPLFEELKNQIYYSLRCMIDENVIETTLPLLNNEVDSKYLIKVIKDFKFKEKVLKK